MSGGKKVMLFSLALFNKKKKKENGSTIISGNTKSVNSHLQNNTTQAS